MPRPDRHRADLLLESGRLLRRKGFAGTSVTEILTAAGATNGSLYHHFPGGKEELACATVEQAGNRILRYLQQLTDSSDGVAEAAQAWIDAMVAALQADARDGCPVAPAAIEAVGVSEPIRTTAASAFDAWEDVFAEALAHDRPMVVARAQASVLLSALEGALLLDRTAGDCRRLRALREQIPSILATD